MMIDDVDYYKEKLANLEEQKKELLMKMRANPRSFEVRRTVEDEFIPTTEAGVKMANELIILNSEIKNTRAIIKRLEPH